jgi:TolA-binding protein
MGTWRKKQGMDDFTDYYGKAVRILRRKKNPTPRERYRLASLEKLLRNYSRAVEIFQSFISGTAGGVGRTMVAGAYFHLGEMALEQTGMKDAENYFLKCLEVGGGHVKAREYLSKLEADRGTGKKLLGKRRPQ